MDLLRGTARAAATAGGQALRAATASVAALRPAPKPLHPTGEVLRATLTRFGGPGTSSSPWLDGAGEDIVLVRLSRAIGLPEFAPDIFGLALRVPLATNAHGDVLFASTGLGPVTRFTLTAGRTPYARPMTTLLPYRSPSGPVLLSAHFAGSSIVELAWARPRGSWHSFGRIDLPDPPAGSDASIAFDPVLNPLPGLATYGWVRRLREPSYLTARRSRGRETSDRSDPPTT